jgi:hypothetical protein
MFKENLGAPALRLSSGTDELLKLALVGQLDPEDLLRRH